MPPAPVLWCGGDKGGVGKSLLASTCLDFLQTRGPVALVEGDLVHSDVYKAWAGTAQVEAPDETTLLDLTRDDGWMRLAARAEEETAPIVINTPANLLPAIESHATDYLAQAHSLARRLVMLWIIDRGQESLITLGQYRDRIPVPFHVLKNARFGTDAMFTLYNHSDLRQQIEAAGGTSHMFPELSARITAHLNHQRLSIPAALQSAHLDVRIGLAVWRDRVHAILQEILDA